MGTIKYFRVECLGWNLLKKDILSPNKHRNFLRSSTDSKQKARSTREVYHIGKEVRLLKGIKKSQGGW